MEHSLFSRFQGSWLGSILSEVLVNRRSLQLKLLQYQPPVWLEARETLALEIIKSPVSCGEFANIEDKLSLYSSSDLALYLLPLILFYVDDFSQWRENVTKKWQQNNSYSPKAAENIQDALIWGNAISLILKAKLKVDNLIESILLDTDKNCTPLIKQLKIVNQALKTGKTMNKVEEELSDVGNLNYALALSLYCFAVAPEDFQLSLNLAIGNQYQTRQVAALTGALSGAYNGFTGIPLKNRLLARQSPIYQPAITIIAKLFNVWSGADREISNNSGLSLVATPNTFQSRPLKIISQTE